MAALVALAKPVTRPVPAKAAPAPPAGLRPTKESIPANQSQSAVGRLRELAADSTVVAMVKELEQAQDHRTDELINERKLIEVRHSRQRDEIEDSILRGELSDEDAKKERTKLDRELKDHSMHILSEMDALRRKQQAALQIVGMPFFKVTEDLRTMETQKRALKKFLEFSAGVGK
ncbi:hypothetical protein HK097_001637 [Rhizophlyctis rosea]|uniref:Uncharacterized protein n=1 Tax=Rhizophlyctis rosea TaxID=64517 RepID=A0AAD5SJ73_9FUNG|nr:hypothetical protein HK097_001637 [Rhizophlyctis rosea]